MKVINVSTMIEAISLATKLSNKYAVLTRENAYESDKDFNGVIIEVK